MQSIAKLAGTVGRRFLGSGDSDAAGADSESMGTAEPRSSLFRCPDCATVYIATDKATCATCETSVDRIPATLTESA